MTFLKENISSKVFHNGVPVQFEPFAGTYGILTTDDPVLIAGLKSLQAKKQGGVFEADEAKQDEVKKKAIAWQSRKPSQFSRSSIKPRMEPRNLEPAVRSAAAGNKGEPLKVPESIKPKPKLPSLDARPEPAKPKPLTNPEVNKALPPDEDFFPDDPPAKNNKPSPSK